MEPIDDYIEHQLIIQAKAKEISSMTLKKDFVAALDACLELQQANNDLIDWLIKNAGKE